MSEPSPAVPDTVNVLGVPIHRLTMEQTVALARHFLGTSGLQQIATANPEFVIAAEKNPAFLAVLRQADLCLPDGIGLVYASRLLGNPLPERVPGSELVYRLAEIAAQDGRGLFLLGAGPGIAQEAAQILQARYPGLLIAGVYAGSPALEENEEIVEMINRSGANLLFVAYGAPGQDLWIARNRNRLTSVKLALGVGGSLDFISGRSVRAPQWMQDLGLEWLHRLVREPWRWRRMLALPQFAAKVLLTRRVKS